MGEAPHRLDVVYFALATCDVPSFALNLCKKKIHTFTTLNFSYALMGNCMRNLLINFAAQ